jgi:hypothetical protein
MRKLLLDKSANYPDRSTITSMTNTDMNVAAEITKRYKEAIAHNRQRITTSLYPLYGREIKFKESILGDVICSINRITQITNMSIEELALYFKSKGIITFFRWEGGKQVPVDSARIIKAFHALKSGMLGSDVKNILYK